MIARPTLSVAALALGTILLCPKPCLAEFIYRPGEGWSRSGGIFGSSAPIAKTAELQLSLAEDLEKKGDISSATEAYQRLIKAFSLSNQAATARFRLGRLLEKQQQWEPAFEALDSYIVKHPDGADFDMALQTMFQIAKRFMDGERRRLFGIKWFSSNQRAEEMFDTILKRAPYSKIAAQVMLFRGMMMERQGKDPEAIATYQQIVERFPGDPVADEAQYQMGYVRMRSIKRGSNDKIDRSRAQESFEDYLSRSPSSEKSAQARQNLQLLEKNHLTALLDIGKFYEKTGKIKSAVVYYRDVIRESESSPEARFAKERLDALGKQFGPDVVKPRNKPSENAENAASEKRMESDINTISRQDYVGPQVKAPPTSYRNEKGPNLRLSPSDIVPLPEPALPLTDPIVNPAPVSPNTPKAATDRTDKPGKPSNP